MLSVRHGTWSERLREHSLNHKYEAIRGAGVTLTAPGDPEGKSKGSREGWGEREWGFWSHLEQLNPSLPFTRPQEVRVAMAGGGGTVGLLPCLPLPRGVM